MKIDNRSRNITNPVNHSQTRSKIDKKSVKEYKKISDEVLKDYSYASYSEGLATLLLMDCPDFITNEIQEEFYSDRGHNSVNDNQNDEIYDLINKKFNGEESYEIMRMQDKIEKYPDVLKKVMSLSYSQNGKPRFNGYECAEIMDYAEKIKDNPGYFSVIVNAKNEDKTPMFGTDDICTLLATVDNVYLSPDEVKKLIESRDKNDKQIFSPEDCIYVLKSNYTNSDVLKVFLEKVKDTDFFESSLNLKEMLRDAKKEVQILHKQELKQSQDEQSEQQEQTYNDEIIKNFKLYKEIQKVSFLKNKKIVFDDYSYSADALLYNIEERAPLFGNILLRHNEDKESRFSSEEYCYVIDNLKIISPNQSRFLALTDVKNADGTYAFNARQCTKLMYNENLNCEQIEENLSIIDPETNEQRFSSEDCMHKYANNPVQDKDLFLKNAFLKDKTNENYRFSLEDCYILDSISSQIKENPELFITLRDMKNKGTPRFSASNIKRLMNYFSSNDRRASVIKKMIDMKEGDSYRFSASALLEISRFVNVMDEDPELFDRILNDKQGDSYRFRPTAIFSIFDRYSDIKNNRDVFELVYNSKLDGKYIFGAGSISYYTGYGSQIIRDNLDLFNKFVCNKNLSESNINTLLTRDYLRCVRNYPKVYDEFFVKNHDSYSRFTTTEKMNMFLNARTLSLFLDKWRELVDYEKDKKYPSLYRCEVLYNSYLKQNNVFGF